MKTPTLERIQKEKKEGTVFRQIHFPSTVYQSANELMDEENKRLGLSTRNEKIHMKDFLHQLTADGVRFRRGEVYTPDDLKRQFSKNPEWVKLKAKAETAIEELFELQKKLTL